ncbi:helix-turn-helix domain-containing protein [Pseudonocardia lacus]|jgi:excisionase family DNA binding protein|uniref:helix-turn-helix domain-containing protein n=1 Tax=Pseudonocardia lacus TaxID=2835865 RepID=UPI001BDBC0E8|nr:helix-turn-helix domain-containing protein [Pseudonocardia lacus]
MADERLLTTAEAAKLLGVSRRTLARYAADGKIFPTVVLPSGHYRWDPEDLRSQLRDARRPRTDD